MNLRSILLISIVTSLAACDSGNDQGAAPEDTGKSLASDPSGTERELDENDGDDSKWRIDYSGDLEGQVSGSIMTTVSLGQNTTVAGMAMNEDSTGAAEQGFRATILTYGDEPIASMSLELADGSSCVDVTARDPHSSSVKILDPEKDTFRAEIEGTLHCGPDKDKKIQYTAILNNDP